MCTNWLILMALWVGISIIIQSIFFFFLLFENVCHFFSLSLIKFWIIFIWLTSFVTLALWQWGLLFWNILWMNSHKLKTILIKNWNEMDNWNLEPSLAAKEVLASKTITKKNSHSWRKSEITTRLYLSSSRFLSAASWPWCPSRCPHSTFLHRPASHAASVDTVSAEKNKNNSMTTILLQYHLLLLGIGETCLLSWTKNEIKKTHIRLWKQCPSSS